MSRRSGRPHRARGPVQTVRTQQVDVILPPHQEPAPVLVQQQDLVAPADPGLPEHRRPVPQIWNREQSLEHSLFPAQIKPDDGSNTQGLKKTEFMSRSRNRVHQVRFWRSRSHESFAFMKFLWDYRSVCASPHEPDWSSWRTFWDFSLNETWLKAAN